MEDQGNEVLPQVSQHEIPLEQASADKPIVLFDLNGVLVGERAPDELVRTWTSRPGIALLLLLLPRYRLGVYSSATWKTVHAAIQHVYKDVNTGRKDLHKHHPAPLLRQSETAAMEQTNQGQGSQPHPAVSKKKGKKGLQFGRSIPGFVMPANASQLFTGGVYHRDHCIQDPIWEKRPDGHDWDTVKPLAKAGLPLGRVLLVDNEMRKVMAGEESSAVELPTWESCADGGVACLRKLVELLLGLPRGTDLRDHSTDISAQVKACANAPAEGWAGSEEADLAEEECDAEEEYEETEHGAKRRRVGEQAHADVSCGYTDPAHFHHGAAAYQGWGVPAVTGGDAGAGTSLPTVGDGSGYFGVGGDDGSGGGGAAVADGSGYLMSLPTQQQQQQQQEQQDPASLPPVSVGAILPMGSKVTQKKPFPCQACPKAFSDMEAAQKHMQMKHKMEPRCIPHSLPYPCTIDGCIKSFATEKARTQHAYQKHGAAAAAAAAAAASHAGLAPPTVSSTTAPAAASSVTAPVAGALAEAAPAAHAGEEQTPLTHPVPVDLPSLACTDPSDPPNAQPSDPTTNKVRRSDTQTFLSCCVPGCKKRLHSDFSLRQHLRQKHGIGAHMQLNPAAPSAPPALQPSATTHHAYCTICAKSFVSEFSLHQHLHQKHGIVSAPPSGAPQQQQHPQQQQQQQQQMEPGCPSQPPPPSFTCGLCVKNGKFCKRFNNLGALAQHHAKKHRMLPGPVVLEQQQQQQPDPHNPHAPHKPPLSALPYHLPHPSTHAAAADANTPHPLTCNPNSHSYITQGYPTRPPGGSLPLYEGYCSRTTPFAAHGSSQPHSAHLKVSAPDTDCPAHFKVGAPDTSCPEDLQQVQQQQQQLQQQQQDLQQQQPSPPRPRLSCLHYEIAHFAQALLPTDEHIAAVDAVMRAVQAAAGALWPNARAVLFGSQACGLNLPGSDLDVVLLNVLDDVETPLHLGSQRSKAISCLRSLGRALVKTGAISGFSVIYAKVPIVKTHVLVSNLPQPPAAPGAPPSPQLSDSGITLPVDISIGALNGADAVPLMRRAVCALPQLRPLCLTVKAMLREAGLNEVFTGGLSSYSLFNMMYSHLQCEGFQPPELPTTRRPATAPLAAAGAAAGSANPSAQGPHSQAATPLQQGCHTPQDQATQKARHSSMPGKHNDDEMGLNIEGAGLEELQAGGLSLGDGGQHFVAGEETGSEGLEGGHGEGLGSGEEEGGGEDSGNEGEEGGAVQGKDSGADGGDEEYIYQGGDGGEGEEVDGDGGDQQDGGKIDAAAAAEDEDEGDDDDGDDDDDDGDGGDDDGVGLEEEEGNGGCEAGADVEGDFVGPRLPDTSKTQHLRSALRAAPAYASSGSDPELASFLKGLRGAARGCSKGGYYGVPGGGSFEGGGRPHSKSAAHGAAGSTSDFPVEMQSAPGGSGGSSSGKGGGDSGASASKMGGEADQKDLEGLGAGADLGGLLVTFFERFGHLMDHAIEGVSIARGGVVVRHTGWGHTKLAGTVRIEDPQCLGRDLSAGSYASNFVLFLFRAALAELSQDTERMQAAAAAAEAAVAAANDGQSMPSAEVGPVDPPIPAMNVAQLAAGLRAVLNHESPKAGGVGKAFADALVGVQAGGGKGYGGGKFGRKRARSDSAAGTFITQLLQGETWGGPSSVKAARRFVATMGHGPPSNSTSSVRAPPKAQAGNSRLPGVAAAAPLGGNNITATGGNSTADDEELAMWASVQADGASVSPALAPYVQQQRQQQQQQQQQMATSLQPESMPQLSTLFDVELAASWRASPPGANHTQAAGRKRGKKRKRGAVIAGAKDGMVLGRGKPKMQRAKSKQQGRQARLLRMESGQGKGSGKNRGRKANKAGAGQIPKKNLSTPKKQQQQQQRKEKKQQKFG